MQQKKQYGTQFSTPIIKKRERNLAMQVFEILQQCIATGELRPNQRLVELEIAKRLGISRTPVREALKRLEVTGYARMLSSGGLAVSDHSPSQIQNLFEIREALETMAIRLACQRVTDKQIHKAEGYYTSLINMIRKGDFEQYVELHRAFHEELYAACGNEQLWSLVRAFRYHYFDRRLARVYTPGDWRTQIAQHGRLLEALRKRSARRAEKVVQRHLRTGLKVALKRLL